MFHGDVELNGHRKGSRATGNGAGGGAVVEVVPVGCGGIVVVVVVEVVVVEVVVVEVVVVEVEVVVVGVVDEVGGGGAVVEVVDDDVVVVTELPT
ncbi:MAG: hypothetical protein MUE34_11280, partial [Acidimicrobiales bacterium]|nr:hypothetical protein [Acidimicrobiales bacterium]